MATVGQTETLSVSFTAGTPPVGVDPTAVQLRVQAPGQAQQLYAGSAITRSAPGTYSAQITPTIVGDWRYRWEGLDGAGVVRYAQDGAFHVAASALVGVPESSRPGYCTIADVKARLYSGDSAPPVTATSPDGEDDYWRTLIATVSRRFDKATGRPPGWFAPQFDVRLHVGRGSMLLDTDPFVYMVKVEYNQVPGQAPVWVDVTSDFVQDGSGHALGTGNRMFVLPPRTWPKTGLLRTNTFVVDPWQTGNVRLTAIWGECEPDFYAAPPLSQTPAWWGLTDAQILSMAPVSPASGVSAGWWVTPEIVRNAMAQWVIYMAKAAQAGYSDTVTTGAGATLYTKGIPPEVQQVISVYTRSRPKLSMVTTDGVVIEDEAILRWQSGERGDPAGVSRWAGWVADH